MVYGYVGGAFQFNDNAVFHNKIRTKRTNSFPFIKNVNTMFYLYFQTSSFNFICQCMLIYAFKESGTQYTFNLDCCIYYFMDNIFFVLHNSMADWS